MLQLIRLLFASRVALVAENLFLRKQLALYQERKVEPRRTTASLRLALVALGRLFDWRGALIIVKPETFIGWHRAVFRRWWAWKSRKSGRPPLPKNIRMLIRRMASENITWGQQQIADELLVKLGIQASARTVAKYLREPRPPRSDGQRWSTFVHNHAKAIVSCDFFQSVTASFEVLYVFVALDIGSRRIIHTNVAAHPTSAWTIQQLKETLPFDHPYQYLIHDRDRIFSSAFDEIARSSGLRVLRTPVRAPMANAHCERVIGTIRRECLDYVIPINERHLRRVLKEFVAHYNHGRPHSSLGPAIPEPIQVQVPAGPCRHELPSNSRVVSAQVLGGLHHDYRLEKEAA